MLTLRQPSGGATPGSPQSIPRNQAHPMRELSGGVSDESARTSLTRGASPCLAIKIGDGKEQQAGSKGACGSNGTKPRPPCDQGSNRQRAGSRGHCAPAPARATGGRRQLRHSSATDFKTEDNQATTGVGELRVSTLCGPACHAGAEAHQQK